MTSSLLHIFAMVFMFLDHVWATQANTPIILTCIGRLAFPIYAFMIAEGFKHTRSVKKYTLRMVAFALISEIPFNLMISGGFIYPFHQNVLWTFLIGLLCLSVLEKAKSKGLWFYISLPIVSLVGYLLGIILMTDYNGAGVLMVIVFYLFSQPSLINKICQFALLYFINKEMLSGYYIAFHVLGFEFNLVIQMLSLLAFIFIWMYNGQKGIKSKGFQYFCYAFYPLHMLLLTFI